MLCHRFFKERKICLAIVAVVSVILLITVDQLSKLYAINVVKPQGMMTVIDNFYYFVYVENRGAAFGMLQNKRYMFIIITVLIFAVFAFMLIRYRIEGKLFLVSIVLIFGGGIGNLIDRIFRGYVVDFLQFSFFAPVCNLADYFITVGAVLLVVSVLFCKKNIAPRKPKKIEAE